MADPTYNGVRDLGALVGGAGAPAFGSEAYIDGLTGGYDAQRAGFQRDKSREDARVARSMAIAREALPDAVRALYPDPTVGNAAAAILGGNSTADLDQLGPLARPGAFEALNAAIAAAGTGDTDEQNRQTALATGKPFEPYSQAGGGNVIYNSGTGESQITDLGAAELLADQARAGASAASGRSSEALADLRSRTDPNRTAGRGAAGAAAVAAAAGRPANARKASNGLYYVPDPDRPGKWLEWQE